MPELKRPEIADVIEDIEVFLVNVATPRHFSFGTWQSRQHAWVRFASELHVGWAEAICATNDPDVDLATWGAPLRELLGKSVSDSLDHLRDVRKAWPVRVLELGEIGVLDLAGRVGGVPAIDLLGLRSRRAVPGLFCILEDKPDRVREQAALAIEQKLASHVKIKIFGDAQGDADLVRAAREILGPQAYLVADANCGYGPKNVEDFQALEDAMKQLRDAGLDACEDPAKMPDDDWVRLQESVGDLDLIPDYPMRPAWRALQTARAGMGRIYNLHPACMGSLIDAVALGHRVRELGGAVMIGDNSLVGPACTVWQQVAIGLGAAWVEAVEKPQESDILRACTAACATTRDDQGRFIIREALPGFGLELDEGALRAACARSTVL